MKNYKRVLSVMLCIAMLFSLMAPLSAFAETSSSTSVSSSTSESQSESDPTGPSDPTNPTTPTKPTTKTTKPKYDPKKQKPTKAEAYKTRLNADASDSLFLPFTITPATQGRIVHLQLYITAEKKYKTIKSYKTKSANKVTVKLEFPKEYRKKTWGKWRVFVEENAACRAYTSKQITVFSRNVEKLSLTSNGVCIYCMDTGDVLYSKNQNKHYSPGSCVKLMTAVVVLESGNLDAWLKVDTRANKVAAPRYNFKAGDAYRKRDLLRAMILPSSNDAAYYLASRTFGSQTRCVKKMNQKVRSLGLKNTHYGDTYGSPGKKQYTCPYDQCRLVCYASKKKEFVNICNTYKYKFTSKKGKKYTCRNGNHCIGYAGHLGGKTGYLDKKVKSNFTGAFKYKGKTYGICQMYAPKKPLRWKDMKKLYKYMRAHAEETY